MTRLVRVACIMLSVAHVAALGAAVMSAAAPQARRPAPSRGGIAAQVAAQVGAQEAAPARPELSAEAFGRELTQYCLGCHNERLQSGGLRLDTVDLADVDAHAPVLERVVRKLRAGQMPPQGSRRPDAATYDRLIEGLETALDRNAELQPNPGRFPLHRLNRTEYGNAIRDLLDLSVDVTALLPADNSSYGFDNMAGVLGISPVLLERYVATADRVASLAVGDLSTRAVVETYTARADLTQEGHLEAFPAGTRGGLLVEHLFPLDAEYVLSVRLARSATDAVRGVTEPQQLEVTLDGARVGLFTIEPPRGGRGFAGPPPPDPDADLRVRLPITAGPHAVGATFIRKSASSSNDLLQPFLRSNIEANDNSGQAHVGTLSIDGPYGGTLRLDTPSRRRVFVCVPRTAPDEEPCATRILTTLAQRAYRRPLTDEDREDLLTFYRLGRAEGFDAGIAAGLQRILASPSFIFRVEQGPAGRAAGTPYAVTDVELASRLSFFLWSSIPDEALLRTAMAGGLREPATLEREVRRMLADAKSDALISNFIGQWLRLRRVDDTTPSPERFPDFDQNLRQSLRRETELFVSSIFREDRRLLDLLSADYTFVDERLARHYGISGVYGSRFRRVPVPDAQRRGLFGHGSILLVTSYPTRTSPVIRGRWIVENILGTPVPDPPPDVPALTENTEGASAQSVRQRMEAHRANPVCASCHRLMDPLGFALEHFDAVGAWRDTETGVPIDTAGTLPDGTPFEGVTGLRAVLLERPELFVSTFTEKLLTYALGRGVEYYDMPTVRRIVAEAADDDYRFSSLVLAIVKSRPFQMRTPDQGEQR